MMDLINEISGCTGKVCGFAAFTKEISCTGRNGSCWTASLLEADESPFHDKALQEATAIIRKTLDAIPKNREGRQLSFVHTPQGTLLAWVKHEETAPGGGVGYHDDPSELAKILRIRPSANLTAEILTCAFLLCYNLINLPVLRPK